MQLNRLAVSTLLIFALPTTFHAQNWFGAPLLDDRIGSFVGMADVDQDGDVDLVRSIFGLQLQVYLNDGIGSFTPDSIFDVPANSSTSTAGVRMGDADGDGFPDIFVLVQASSGSSGGFSFHRNTGGSFGPSLFVQTGDSLRDFELGDADDDGDVEVAALFGFVGQGTDRLAWYDWNGTGFTASADVLVGGTGTSLATGDWNGDGAADMVAGKSFSNELVTATTLGGAPVLGVSLFASIGTGFVVQAHAADADGDGDDDVVAMDSTLSQTIITVFQSDGAGGLQGIVTSELNERLGGDEPRFADLDGDGDDEAIGRPLSSGGGPEPYLVLEAVGDGSYQLGWDEQRIGGETVDVADLDADGELDFVTSRTIVWGTGEFASPYVEDLDPALSSLRTVDWEGDGDLDLILDRPNSERFVLRVNDGTGGFSETGPKLPVQSPGQSYVNGIALVDVDGDGLRDLIAGSELFLFGPPPSLTFLAEWRYVGDGAGNLVPDGIAAPPLGTSMPLKPRSSADVDSDGDVDFVVDGGSTWINDGAGLFFESVDAHEGIYYSDHGDVDGDGDEDLLVLGNQFVNPDLILSRNDGAGCFTSEVLLSVTSIERIPRLFDLDDDGDLDVVGYVRFSTLAHESVFVMENLGGTFGPAVTVGPSLNFSNPPEVFAVFDVDLDGKRDLVVLDQGGFNTSSVLVFRRSGPGLVFEAPRTYVVGRSAEIADIDGDGDPDVVGTTLFRGTAADVSSAGSARQFGLSVAGTGGALPLLGSMGPSAVGDLTELRVRHAVGGTLAFLVVGSSPVSQAGVPFGGLTNYVGGIQDVYTLTLAGTPNEAGVGRLDLPVLIGPSLAGLTQYLQVYPVDGLSPNGLLTQSNALELTFGQ